MGALSYVEAASLLEYSLRSKTVYIGLFLTDPTPGANGQEASGGGYTRQVITFGEPSLVENKQQVANTNVINWSKFTANIGTIHYWAIFDSLTGGTQKWQEEFNKEKLIEADDSIQLEVGAITIDLS